MRSGWCATCVAALLPVSAWAGPADPWAIDPQQSSITFTAKQMGSPLVGKFERFRGEVRLDPADLANARIRIEIETASAKTGTRDVDSELPKPVLRPTSHRVLDDGRHLSYPFLFRHAGELYMIPESSAAGRVDLWRCSEFPGTWRRERTLIADISAADTSLLNWNGRWWLFATSLTHLGHTLRVTDTATGAVYQYTKPAGDLGSLIDLSSLR